MKRRPDELAILGGDASFLTPLLVGRPAPFDRSRFFERLNWAMDNEWLTNGGPLSTELETRIADLVGARYCIATANGTLALQVLSRAVGITGEVIVPSFTFVASAHAFQWLGVNPVFCDVCPGTGCIDVAAAAAAITDQTSAIIGVHLWGQLCNVDELASLAYEHGLHLLFDGAHALGCTTADGLPVGTPWGKATILSFHATKVVHGFEGGAVVTNDSELATRLRGLRNFGNGIIGGHMYGGTNAKMSEASAAACLTSLESFEETVIKNQHNHQQYLNELRDLPGVRILDYAADTNNNYNYVIMFVDEATAGISRDLLVKVLLAEGVFTKTYFDPACHQMEPYSRRPWNLPVTEKLGSQVVALPTGGKVNSEDIRRVCSIIRLAVLNGHKLTHV